MGSPLIWAGKQRPALLFVMLGQSNMVGVAQGGSLPSHLSAVIPNTYIYNGSTFAGLQYNVNNEGTQADYFGPELNFGFTMQGLLGVDIYIVKSALGGSSLHTDWAVPSGARLVAAKSKIDAAIAVLEARGLNVVIPSFFFMQGEADAAAQVNADAYKANATALINNLFTTYAQYLPDPLFVMGQITLDRTNDVWRRNVMQQQHNLAASNSSVLLVNTTDLTIYDAPLPGGSQHFDADAEITLGARFANAFASRDWVQARLNPRLSLSSLSDAMIFFDTEEADKVATYTTAASYALEISALDNVYGSVQGVQDVAPTRPLLFPKAKGDTKNLLQFNSVSSSRFLNYGTTLNSNFTGASSKWSFLNYFKQDSSSATSHAIMGAYSAADNQRSFFYGTALTTPRLQLQWQPNAGGASVRTIRGGTTLTMSNFYTSVVTYDATVDTNDGADRVKIWLNGVPESMSNISPGGALFAIPTTTAPFCVGAVATVAGVNPVAMFRGEMNIWAAVPRLVTDAEVAAWHSYCHNKFGVS